MRILLIAQAVQAWGIFQQKPRPRHGFLEFSFDISHPEQVFP